MLRVILLDEALLWEGNGFSDKTMEVEREFLRIFSRDRNAFRDADCLALMQDIDSAKKTGRLRGGDSVWGKQHQLPVNRLQDLA